uniref:Flavin-binding monooxygenase n=1 Tax=uncultured bacterium UPO43 TaxID=1776968 RepID=A0A126SY05_9BACT|nr:flavin-binding monooxygenase [uncultured bacterium UPO43]
MPNTTPPVQPEHFDALVVGAGFAGLYALHKLRDQMGLRVRVYEAGGGVGGTWYWNRYPGARCDIESHQYSYSFSEALQQEWRWSEKYAAQPEILRYLEHVAERFDLKRDITFDTRISGARFDEANNEWVLEVAGRAVARAPFLISALGTLSAPKPPEYPGFDSFRGQVYVTGTWPHAGVDFTGQRVAVIGTGASGVQAIPEIARQAAQLTVFQRTPNFATPSRNGPMTADYEQSIKSRYAALRRQARESFGGIPFDQIQPSALAVSPEERRQVYERCYAEGGFRLFFDSFADLLIDPEANRTAAEFVHEKIRSRVKDPAVAELLCPKDHPYGTKRPPLEMDYYETYNRDNVRLVDLHRTPIEAITPQGIRTTEGEHEFDSIVLATGFDASTGPLLRMNVRGRGGLRLNDKWADGPRTYLGLAVQGFPNLFVITGPQSPSVLYNMPLAIEDHVEWAADCIAYLRARNLSAIEPTLDAEDRWIAHTNEVAAGTLLPRANSWYMGANVPGKPRAPLVYLGGAPAYRKICDEVAAEDYRGFVLTPGAPVAEPADGLTPR